MSKKKFIRAMGRIDDQILERYVEVEDRLAHRPRSNVWLRFTALAACIALVLLALPYAAFMSIQSFSFGCGSGDDFNGQEPGLFPPSGAPLAEGALYTADEVAALFGEAKDGETNAYTTVYAPASGYLAGVEIFNSDHLPVYSYTSPSKPLDRTEFTSFVNSRLASVVNLLGVSLPEYEIKKNTYSFGDELSTGFDASVYKVYASQSASDTAVYINAALSEFSVDGKRLSVDLSASDDKILYELSAVGERLASCFGIESVLGRVVRTYGESGMSRIDVYFYRSTQNPLDLLCSAPVSDAVCISFDLDHNYTSVKYRESRGDGILEYAETVRARALTVGEAEELLRRGYVFGGHACPECMKAQDAIDFADYDKVGLVYISGRDPETGVPTVGLPFYAFYKRIGKTDGGNYIYARTYVCAIEVSGLAEYFEAQRDVH